MKNFLKSIMLPATRKMTLKIHQKISDLNAREQPSVDFYSENSKKVLL